MDDRRDDCYRRWVIKACVRRDRRLMDRLTARWRREIGRRG